MALTLTATAKQGPCSRCEGPLPTSTPFIIGKIKCPTGSYGKFSRLKLTETVSESRSDRCTVVDHFRAAKVSTCVIRTCNTCNVPVNHKAPWEPVLMLKHGTVASHMYGTKNCTLTDMQGGQRERCVKSGNSMFEANSNTCCSAQQHDESWAICDMHLVLGTVCTHQHPSSAHASGCGQSTKRAAAVRILDTYA